VALYPQGCEREFADASTEGQRNDSLMRLSWALVHSRQTDDVNRGISMLEGSYLVFFFMQNWHFLQPND
jgi:hypothetical protein